MNARILAHKKLPALVSHWPVPLFNLVPHTNLFKDGRKTDKLFMFGAEPLGVYPTFRSGKVECHCGSCKGKGEEVLQHITKAREQHTHRHCKSRGMVPRPLAYQEEQQQLDQWVFPDTRFQTLPWVQ